MDSFPAELLQCIKIHLNLSAKVAFTVTCKNYLKLWLKEDNICNDPILLSRFEDGHKLRMALEIKTLTMIDTIRCDNIELYKYFQKIGISPFYDVCGYAAYFGSLNFLEQFYEDTNSMTYNLESSAIHGGQLEALKWLQNKKGKLVEHVCGYAIQYGELEILKYLLENGYHVDQYAMSLAIRAGRVEIIDYLHINLGLKINPECSWIDAIGESHIHVLDYLHAKAILIDEHDVFRVAIVNNKFEALKWLYIHGYQPYDNALDDAVDRGFYNNEEHCSVEIVKWLLEKFPHRYRINDKVCYYAARNGHLELLQSAQKQHYSFNDRVISTAAWYNQEHIVEWLLTNNYPFNEDVCDVFARNGNLEMLKFVRNYGCPWTSKLYETATWNEHFHIIEYAYENGCPWNLKLLEIVARRKNFRIMKWICKKNLPYVGDVCSALLSSESENGKVSWSDESITFVTRFIMKLVNQRGHPLTRNTVIDAIKLNLFELVKWMRERGCPWDKLEYYPYANNFPIMRKWILNN